MCTCGQYVPAVVVGGYNHAMTMLGRERYVRVVRALVPLMAAVPTTAAVILANRPTSDEYQQQRDQRVAGNLNCRAPSEIDRQSGAEWFFIAEPLPQLAARGPPGVPMPEAQ